MIDKICICGKTYKRYDDLYFVTNDGVVALIEFDDNDDYITISHYHFEAASVGIAKYLIEQYITGL